MHYSRLRKHGHPDLTKTASPGEPQAWVLEHKDHAGTECLDWPFAKVPLGYGYVRWAGRLERVARVMCMLRHGEPKDARLEAAHSCGNAHCVNPQHLRWASPSENQSDKLKHGTHNRGSMRSFAKLDDFDVLAIRGSRDLPSSWLAKKYGVSRDHISRLQREERWSWL